MESATKQGETAQSALSTLASTIKQTNRYRKLVDTDDELEKTAQDSSPEKQAVHRLEIPGDERSELDSVGSATDLQKRMEVGVVLSKLTRDIGFPL